MTDETRVQRARTFDEAAGLYDRARRKWPDDLVDGLFALAGMNPAGANVLEIGCGTGQATLPLARRGCRVLALEMGANLANIARRKLAPFPCVNVANIHFEDWEPMGATFDLALAANSWHWLDPRLRYQKAAAVVRPGGVLAFTIVGHGFPPGFDPFFLEIQDCYKAIGEARISFPPPLPEEIPERAAKSSAAAGSRTSASCDTFGSTSSPPANMLH
jgi:SAM-dependent methyltransferase